MVISIGDERVRTHLGGCDASFDKRLWGAPEVAKPIGTGEMLRRGHFNADVLSLLPCTRGCHYCASSSASRAGVPARG
jgi:hypothetical protein